MLWPFVADFCLQKYKISLSQKHEFSLQPADYHRLPCGNTRQILRARIQLCASGIYGEFNNRKHEYGCLFHKQKIR